MEASKVEAKAQSSKKKILIVFYSRTGHTSFLVKAVQDQLVQSGFEVDVHAIEALSEFKGFWGYMKAGYYR